MAAPTVRRAGLADLASVHALLDQVDELHARALPWLLRRVDAPPSDDWLRAFVVESDHAALLAHASDGTPVGLLLCLIREPGRVSIVRPARVAEIDTLVVDSSFRRQGVGKTLVRAALEWARDSGATRTELGVYEFNDDALRFWHAMGFETLSRRLVMHDDASGRGL
jgi:ribosomal protein S18 acetylase RimI-like enzyme